MRNIGIPDLALLSPRSGIGRVIHNLKTHLNGDSSLRTLNYQYINLPFLRNFPIRAITNDLNVVIFPQLTGVRNVRIFNKSTRSIAVIHDIGIIDCLQDKDLLNPVSRAIIKYDLKCLKYIDLIVAVSEFTKQRIIKYYPDLEGKIAVVKNSLSESFINFKTEKEESKKIACEDLNIRKESHILLCVGTELPRKNLTLLFDAFVEVKKTDRDVVLIKAGGSGGARWRDHTLKLIHERGLDIEKDVFIRDNISEEDLLNYYNSATATILPSLYEGFGLPAIESIALGTPIVASNGSAMDEIASRFGMIHAPTAQDFKHAIIEIITNGISEKQKLDFLLTRDEYSPQLQAKLMLNLIDKLH